MKNYTKYICLFLMLFGMSFGQKAWAGLVYMYPTGGTTSITSGTSYSTGATVTFTVTPNTGYYCPESWDGHYGVEGMDGGYNDLEGLSCIGYNTFSFTMPSTNAYVWVEFKQSTAHSITYHVPTCVTSIGTQTDSRFRTPSASDDLSAYKFEGWVTSSCSPTTTRPTTIYPAGDGIPDDVDEVYALYSSVSGNSLGLQTSSISGEGKYILTSTSNNASSNMMINSTVSNNRIGVTTISTTGNVISCSSWEGVWTFTPGTGSYSSYWFIHSEQNGKYLAVTDDGESYTNDYKATLIDEPTTDANRNKAAWTISSISNSGQIQLQNKLRDAHANKPSGYRVIFSLSNYGGFYSSVSKPYIFAASSVTTTYTTSPSCSATYTVTYDPNGATSGTAPTDNTEYDEDATVTVKTNSGNLAKTGYTFSGWNTKANGTGTTYSAVPTLGTFTITENTTLYAKWTANEYVVTLDKDGGSGGSSSVTATYGAAMPSAGAAPTLSGYTFGGYYGSIAGGGTQYYNATPASVHNWDVASATTIYAKWTQTVALNANGGAANKSVDVVLHGTGTSSFTEVTRTGYTCTGYWDNTSGGNLVIKADGTLNTYSSDISGYINSSGQWCHSGATTLYAQWEANLYTVTFYKNDISATGSMDAQLFEYGTAQNLSTCTFERTGYSFVGWATTSSGGKAYDDGEEVNNLTTTPDGNVDLFALWSINSYTLTVGTPDNVTITAEPDGGSEMEEGDYDDVEYNTTITLAYTGMTSGYFWGGWRVTDGSGNDITEDVMYDENTMFMPASNATVTALLYTNAKAWCPVITLEWTDGSTPILVTSVGGQSVKAVRTLHLTVTGAPADASRIEIRGNDLEFYDGTTKITDSNLKCSSKSLDKTITVAYAPSAYVDESWANPTITVECYTAASGGTIAASIDVDDLVNARCLPDNGTGSSQGFVIAAQVGDDEWLALPNSMSAGTQDGLPIVVNSTSDPSVATLAPSTARYNLYNVYATSGFKDRFKANGTYVYLAGDGTKALKSAASGANISLGVNVTPGTYDGSAADPAYIEWLLSTTDKKNYTLTNNGRSLDPDVSNDLKYYTTHDKFGMYAYNSQVITEFRLLPATFYTAISAEVTEWGKKSVILDVDAQSIAGVQAHFGDRAEAEKATSFGQTKTSVKNADSKYNYTLTFSTLDFSTHKGEVVYFDWLDGDDNVVSTSLINIPWIIATSGTMSSIEDTKEEWNTEVHVLPGVTLTADGGSFDDDAVEIEQLEIYPGATVKVTTGTLTATNLMMRNGWTRAGGKEYDVARLYITPADAEAEPAVAGANLIATNAYSDWYIDYDQYYPIAVPWAVTTSGMTYLNSTNSASAGVRMRYYDGEGRAEGSNGSAAEGANWIEYSPLPATLSPCKGYAMTARRPTGKAFSIVRMPLTIPSASWTALGEQGEVSEVHKDQVVVYDYAKADGSTPKYAQGWNYIANPYMALHQGALTYTSGGSIEYATVPDIYFREYDQKPIATTKLKPASGFLVQVPKEGTVTFGTINRKRSAPSYRKEEQEETTQDQKAYIVLSNDDAEDMMGILVAEQYTEAYETNADLQKLLGDGTSLKTYMLYGDMNMAYVAINESLAKEWIPVNVRIPEDGEYTFSLHEASVANELEGVYLIDYANGDQVTNLINQNYTFVADAGTINGRFAINAIVGERQTPTDIDVVNGGGDLSSDKPFKFIYHEKVYIYHRGVIYDATGKKVK